MYIYCGMVPNTSAMTFSVHPALSWLSIFLSCINLRIYIALIISSSKIFFTIYIYIIIFSFNPLHTNCQLLSDAFASFQKGFMLTSPTRELERRNNAPYSCQASVSNRGWSKIFNKGSMNYFRSNFGYFDFLTLDH